MAGIVRWTSTSEPGLLLFRVRCFGPALCGPFTSKKKAPDQKSACDSGPQLRVKGRDRNFGSSARCGRRPAAAGSRRGLPNRNNKRHKIRPKAVPVACAKKKPSSTNDPLTQKRPVKLKLSNFVIDIGHPNLNLIEPRDQESPQMKLDPEARLVEYERVVEHANGTKDPLDHNSIQKIDQLIEESNTTDDPVFQVNCLQLIADLACSAQSLKILEERQVPQKLISLLQASDPLIVPHALKFFYRVNPSHLGTKYSPVLEKICDYCDAENTQLLDYAIDFIAAIGRGGYQARKILQNHPNFKQKCLERLGSTLVCSSDLIKSRALKCIYDLLEVHQDDSKDESEKLSESFYFAILPGEHKMTDRLLSLCRYPFMEIRVNALRVVAAVSGSEWGQKELATHPTFVKWILDRSTEKCKEGKEAKFEILKTLVNSRTTTRYFKGEDYMELRADYKKGPFHVGVAEEMMVDEKTG